MRPRLVLFDFDGTLAETREAVAITVNASLAAHGWPRLVPSVIHGLMGAPLRRCFEVAIPPYKRPVDVTPMIRWYQEQFATLGAPHVHALPGAVEAVNAARAAGLAVGIVTSREASTLHPLLEQLGLTGPWATIVPCDRVVNGKPHPEAVALALADTGCDAAHTWMIGDTTFDVEMAVAAGVYAVGVASGAHDDAQLTAAGAQWVIGGVGELIGRW